ncbi:MAG: DUF4837 family protein [candidate division WOR-3 bacterium]|nr:DUF4837 family protein [candidate division WOR-3 bacterium]
MLNPKCQIGLKFLVVSYWLLALSCSPPLPTTIGGMREIILFTDYKQEIELPIKEILQRYIYTVQPEEEFIVRYRPLSRLSDFIKFRFLFIVGTIDEEPIRTILDIHIKKIEMDTMGLFAFADLWVENQKVLIFAVKSKEFLQLGLKRYGARIRKTFQDYLLTYMTKITYEQGHDKKLTKYLSDKYQFNFKVPKRFRLITKYENDNFIYMITHNPDRSIFIYTSPERMEITPAKLISLRDSLTAKYYEGDFVYKPYTRAETTLFNNIWAIKLIGVWQNNKLTAGGPFISYCFNHNNRFYFLDGMLYYPGKKKLDNLNQLNAILWTFTP